MKCEECPFNNSQKIPSEGSRIVREYEIEIPTGKAVFKQKVVERDNEGPYDIVVVGIAPAKEELREGRPLVGPSGKVLRGTLEQMGIKEYYLTNVLLCNYPDDTTDAVMKQAVEACKERLDGEIVDRKPKLIITLGDIPLHALVDTDYRIKEVEGRVIPSRFGIPLLPLTHPAYYLRRDHDEFFDFIECMRSGVRFLEGKYWQTDEPTWEVVTDESLGRVKDELEKHEELGVDLETTGFFAYGWEPDRILELGISVDGKHAFVIRSELIPKFKDLLERKKCIFWNAQFDCAFLKQVGINAYAYFDGMIAHYTIDERPYSHGLKRVARIYLGSDNWESDLDQYIPKRQKKSVSYEVVPFEARCKYLAKDVTRTLQLRWVLDGEVNKKVFWDMLMPACRMFIEVEHRGMRIDPVKIMELDPVLEDELVSLESDINKETSTWINPNSPKQVSEFVYGELGLPLDPYLGPTTNKGYLAQFEEQYPVVGKILDYREVAKLKGTYIEGFAKFVDKTYRIHPYIKLYGSVTGRLSSENPSIMNVKSLKTLKSIFLPEPGHILGYFDIKGNELVWYCIISGDKALTKILREEGDPHHVVSVAAYGEEKAREMRTQAKAVVFGRIYKRGRKSIEAQVGHGVIDKVMEAVDGVAPDIDKYYKMIVEKVKKQGYLDSYFDRRRRFSLITESSLHEIERQAVNFPIQSSGSDLMLLNFLYLWENKDKWGIWPFWPIHDSITIDAPSVEVLPEIKKALEAYSYEVVEGIIPFIWEYDWGYDWSMRKE